jgi:predicted transcriptional regulator
VTTGDIPQKVRRFLREQVNSLVQLEVLLLLQSGPESEWTVDAVNRELNFGIELVRKHLADLHERGLIALVQDADDRYRYDPETTQLAEAVTALAKCYKERRVSITSFIYSRPLDDVRQFADAFKIMKDE